MGLRTWLLMILISVLIRHLLISSSSFKSSSSSSHSHYNEIASLFFFVGCRARMKKEDILSIKSKILIIGTNLDNQPKKRERGKRIVESRKTLVMEICLTARQKKKKQKKSFFRFFSGLLFVTMLQFFAEVHSFLLILELEFLLLRGFECGNGESRLLFLSRHLGEARTNFGHLLQLRLHEFSLNVVHLDGQLVDVRVLLDESVLEVDGVDQRLPHLLVQLDASVLQRGGVEPVDVEGADFS